jgi:mono/diheme cytochrome c family protein
MDPRFLMHVIRLMERFPDHPAWPQKLRAFSRLADPLVDLQLALSLGPLTTAGGTPDFELLAPILTRTPADTLLVEATLSGLSGQEAAYRSFLLAAGPDPATAPMLERLATVIGRAAEASETTPLPSFSTRTDPRTRGMQLFRTHCATCHGMGGLGIDKLAPPLAGSDYVAGSGDRLILLTLHGLSGPIHINGRRYEGNAVMPGVKENSELSDADVAAMLTFVKNAFSQTGANIRPDRVKALRREAPAGYSFTEEELRQKVQELLAEDAR